MPPKKKGNRKDDDWDEGLGESPDPIAAATEQAKADEAAQNDAAADEGGSGGLLAALKKNRGKKAKKGKVVNEIVEDEDLSAQNADGATANEAPGQDDLASKAPQEASMEDEDVFAPPSQKGKGAKGAKGGKQPQKVVKDEDDDDDGELDESGKVKSKKEKEKEKREREKQRKKEQV